MTDKESSGYLGTRKLVTRKNVSKQKPKPPSYKEMVRSALFDLMGTKGTPRDAILNYICTHYDIKNNALASRRLNVALTAGVSDGTFRKSKGTNKMVDRYFIGVTKVLESRKVAKKPAKMGLRVKTKTANIKKSKPQQNKSRIKPQQKGRAGKRVQLVKSQVKSKRKSPEQRNISQQEVLSKSDVEQLSTSTNEKVENQSTDTPHTSEEITELRNEDHCLTNLRFIKQDPIILQTPGDLHTKHLTVSSLTATPDGRLLIVDVHQACSYIKMFDIEGHHLSEIVVSSGQHEITTANDEEAILLHWSENKIFILDISSAQLSVKQQIEIDTSLNAKYVTAFQDKIILSCWCYPASINMIDRTGKIIWSSRVDDINNPPFKSPSSIVSILAENKPKIIVANVAFLREGLVQLDAETGEITKVKRFEKLLITPLGMDVDAERGILYIVSSKQGYMVWGSTLDLEQQRLLLTTNTGLSVGSHNLCFNRANQQLLVTTKDIIDRFQVVS